LIEPVYCSELPPPPPADASELEEEKKEEPIYFDESESPFLAELAKKFPLRPSSFENLLTPLRMVTHIEPNDGLKVDVGIGISQRLQISNSWVLPHAAPGSYNLTCLFAGGKMDNPFDPAGPNPLMMSRMDPSTGR
jgi:hypothetical protein